MALTTKGLKKKKKIKKGSSVSKIPGPPKSKLKKPPKYWTGQPVAPGTPPLKRPKPIAKPGPGKPPPKKGPPRKPGPGKPPVRKPKPPGKGPARPRPKPVPPGAKVPPKKGGGGFGGYVAKHPDLAKAFKKHKAAGGKGTAASWGASHYKKHGKKEGRKR